MQISSWRKNVDDQNPLKGFDVQTTKFLDAELSVNSILFLKILKSFPSTLLFEHGIFGSFNT